MTGSEMTAMILAFPAGVLLGMVFFGGLWWTIRRGLSSPHPARWFLAGFLVRMTFLLAALYYLSGGAWARLIILLAGILLGRSIVIRQTKSTGKNAPPEQEVFHATQP